MAFFAQLLTILSAISVSWFQTEVHIPVYEPLDAYLDIPYATLEMDGKAVDTTVYYQRSGVNYTFPSTINTHILKTYTLYYEAYFPEYDIKSKQAITFTVFDDEPPRILKLPTFELPIGSDPPDYMVGLVYEDNYDEVDDIVVEVNDHFVQYDMRGTYTISYILSDSSYQQTNQTTTVNIVDVTPPLIEQTKAIVIERLSHPSLTSYFKVEDNDQVEPTLWFDDEAVDYHHVGTYDLKVYAIDQSNNQSSIHTVVHVIDTTPPEIIVTSEPQPIHVGDEKALDQLYSYILSINDQGDAINIHTASIIHDIQIHQCGTYQMTIYAADDYGNEANQTLAIKVVDLTPPQIILKSPLVIPVFSDPLFLASYFDITDNYDAYHLLDIDIDTSIDYDHIGRYMLTVTVKDQAKNQSIYQDYVEIIDTYPPAIEQNQAIIITDFMAHPLYSYFTVSDNYDDTDDISLTYDDQAVDYEHTGMYPLFVYAIDQSENQVVLETEVIVMDVIAPTLILSSTVLTIDVDEELIDFRSLIVDVSDNYSVLDVNDVEIDGEPEEMQVGVYDIIYHVRDDANNMTYQTLTCIVEDYRPPVITCEPLTVLQYETIHLFEGITVYDESSTYELYLFPESINTDQPGEKYLTYVAQDARGNYAMATQKITVLPTKNSYQFEDFIPLIIVIIIGGIMIFTIKKHA